MGFYVEPEDQSIQGKQQWLNEHAIQISEKDALNFFKEVHDDHNNPTCLLCAIVNNPFVMAIAYIFSPQELNVFTDYRDPRPRSWYLCDQDTVEKYCPSLQTARRNG